MSDNSGSGMAVGSGRSVGSTVGIGVGWGAQAARAIIATSKTESKLKGFIFFSYLFCKMICTTYGQIIAVNISTYKRMYNVI
jgi:hypothetical protein